MKAPKSKNQNIRDWRGNKKVCGVSIDGLETSLPIILLDHQPNDLQDAGRYVDIQLSGHTHMGQIFPASFITGIIYELDCGILTRDSYNLIVTSGYGTWGPPLRIGTRSEVVLVTLNFME